jgi:3-hydroxyacyl-CoA dehydrogenase/enoyl-CoA hydratase/3-hydroxybutyryl-CoA epimerase
MIGITDALLNVLLQGSGCAGAGHEAKLSTSWCPPGRTGPAALAWMPGQPDDGQPWDRPGYRMPGGRPTDKSLASMLPAYPANLRKQLKGANYPAPRAIMSACIEGASVDVDTALRIEGRYFASLVGTPIQRNLTQASSSISGTSTGAAPGRRTSRDRPPIGSGSSGPA